MPILVIGPAAGPLVAAVICPDSVWIPGIYDGGDTDDLVLAATRADGIPPVLGPVPVPRAVPVSSVCVLAVAARSTPDALGPQSRGPPRA